MTEVKKIQNDNRLLLDVLKGFAIFLMLWGHCRQYSFAAGESTVFDKFYLAIYSFHMPLLMLVSGYLFFYSFSKRDLKTLVIHRTQSMLQPIIMGTILYYFTTYYLINVITGEGIVKSGGLWLQQLTCFWFLWSVLAASLVVGCAEKSINNRALVIIVLIVGVFVVGLFPCSEMNIYMYPYFLLGFCFAKYRDRLDRIIKLKYLCVLVYPVMLYFFESEHLIYTSGLTGSEGLINNMPTNLFRWGIGLIGSVAAITVIELILKAFKDNRITKCFSELGKNSLQIYVLSCVFVSFYLPRILKRAGALCGVNIIKLAHNPLVSFGLAVISAICLYAVAKVLEKIKVGKLIFGR